MEQGSAEWLAERCGKVTASRIYDVVARSKRDGSPLQSYYDYMTELIAETLSGETYEHYVNQAMQWGTDTEPYAVSEYELECDVVTERIGFVQHPTIELAGASPDRLVGDDGLLEVKCPTSLTHVNTRITGEIDPRYQAQMQWQLACTGRRWCDFMSYDPRFPDPYSKWIYRVDRDEAVISDYEAKVREFIAILETRLAAVRERKEVRIR